MISRQLGLFERQSLEFDPTLSSVKRTLLPNAAWFDYVPGWLCGHWQLFEQLSRECRWRHEQREMYERVVEVPRLYAMLPEDGPGHPVIVAMQDALSRHYGSRFERVGLALYRDGRDSVAWHGDYVARTMPSALVATVSVGAQRRFLLRPAGGGRSLGLNLGSGDLLVMGGTCQRTWQHHIPKVARAEPRIAILFRPEWEAASSPARPAPQKQ
ncbi:MAG TPA: alpha-ketoglutarate-dependent dioxygenase AlkB [Polyangiaceae bacterium]|nr:alpha-ketoglutarate-dependent dioxygenase AlkB [Polyangiaceae bacterium]